MSLRYNELIESSAKEKDLVKAIIAKITGLSTYITCEEDPDDEYDESTAGSSHVPEFNFKANSKAFFTIKRKAALSSTAKEFTMTIYLSETVSVTKDIPYSNDATAYSEDANRSLYISYLISNTFFGIHFKRGNSNNFMAFFAMSAAKCFKAGKNVGNTTADIFDISSRSFYDTDSTDVGTFISRFSYAVTQGTLDYIKSSVYHDSSSGSSDLCIKIFDINSVYDCTTVTVGDTISLEDGNYLAVGTHQLVKIS